MKHIFVGMKKASKRNLHLLKRDMPMNESYHISSFRSLTNYRFFDTYLIVSYQKGEENCLFDVSIITRKTAFKIIPECQNKSGIQINIRMMRYDMFIFRTIHVFYDYQSYNAVFSVYYFGIPSNKVCWFKQALFTVRKYSIASRK